MVFDHRFVLAIVPVLPPFKALKKDIAMTATLTSNRLDFLNDEIQALKDQHLFQTLVTVDGPQGAEVMIDGQKLINFSSNNYLGLCTHPKLKEASKKAIDTYGVGAGAVRTIIGTLDIHQQLEEKLAQFKHCEAVLVFQSGFTASQAAITSVLGDGDAVISDELNHACIIDGIRLLKGVDKYVYSHSDMADLEAKLRTAQSARRRLVVTDGVFSMDGGLAKLPEIVALCEKYNAIVMVDDAHGSGVFGDHGRGTVDHFNLHGRVDITVGTMSKAIGAMGGYIASTKAMRDILINKARPMLFSTPHPPAVVASCMAAFELLEQDDTLVQKLWYNARYFKAGMKSIGFDLQTDSPIMPVIVGPSEKAFELSKKLYAAGIYGRPIVFPTVAKDKARVRLIITAAHTQAHLDHAIEAFKTIGREMGLI